ncbi:uncharacterized protein LOC127866386 isoform X2 [Dreissena polymorpha]|uniref:uncharacterized protein LOC127866386 isoform X2 n=1 Tax=Dreissena polymorpha TaxID=45954 RepID=UPI0022644524|nr:uncharacterized protein LOC127866386 isoform X2 [Dreissena polymorpha]
MKSLILLCVIGYVVGEPCAYGPPYWCSHVSRARTCGAVKHCIDTEWKYTILPKISAIDKDLRSTSTCTYCELLVSGVKDAAHSKSSQVEIASLLSNVCTYLPNAELIKQCQDIVTEFTPEVIEMLDNKLSTDMICTALGFCAGLEDTGHPEQGTTKLYSEAGVQLLYKSVGNVRNDTQCADCTKFFKDVQDSITSQETLDQLEQLLNQTICSRLGSLSQLCDETLEEILPIILKAVADNFGPLQYRSSEECDICKQLLGQVVSFLRDSTTQAKVKEILENEVCTLFGGLKDRCKQLVEEYTPMIFELLVNELDPTTLCEAVGLCVVSSRLPVVAAAVMVPARMVEPASMVGAGFVKDSTECTVCKYLVQEVDNVLKQNQTIQTIEDLLDKICDRLPTPDLKTQCEAFVEEYGPLVLSLLAQELDPQAVCQTIGLCKKTNAQVSVQLTKCDACVAGVTVLENLVANISQEQILSFLNMVCDYVPENYTATCKKYLQEYGPLIVSALKSRQDPKTLCALAQFCTAKLPNKQYMTVPIPQEPVPAVARGTSGSVECDVCGTVLYFLEFMMKAKATQEEIKHSLDKLCTHLHGSMPGYCKTFVDTYLPKAIDLLIQAMDVELICAELGLCREETRNQKTASKLSAVLSPLNTLPVSLNEEHTVQLAKGSASPSIECEVCGTVLYYVKILLQNNATVDEIKQALDKLCTDLPSSMSGICQTFVDTYLQQAIDLLVKEIDINTICAELGLCNGVSSAVKPASLLSVVLSPLNTLPISLKKENTVQLSKDRTGPSIECEVCGTVLYYVKILLQNNATVDEIKQAMDKLCTDLPSSLSGFCQTFVDTYLQQAIDLLVKEIDINTICAELGLCNGVSSAVKPASLLSAVLSPLNTLPIQLKKENTVHLLKAAPLVGDDKCTLCVEFAKLVDQELQNNQTQAFIKKVLKDVCASLPDSLRDECSRLVEENYQLVIDFILLNYDPNIICKMIGICPAHKVTPVQSTVTEVKSGPICGLCELIIQELDSILKGNKSEASIKAALEQVCSLLPDTLSTECKQFVDQYAQQIIDLLLQEIDPDQICKLIGLCTTSGHRAEKILVKAGPVCVICEFVLKLVDKELQGNKSEAAITAALDKVCSLMPDTISVECNQFVSEYAKLIINLLVQELADPDTVCKALKVCTTSKQSVPIVHDKVPLKAGPVCVICEFVLKLVDKELQGNKSEAAITAALDKVCSLMPDTISVECNQFVSEYAKLIINLLVQELADPDTVCKALKVCTTSKQSVPIVHDKAPLKAGPVCVICEFVLKLVDKELQGNKSEAAITAALDKVCSLMPDTISVECNQFVSEYAKLIINLLVQELANPDTVCKALKVCTADLLKGLEATVHILKEKPKVGADFCVPCEFIVKQVQEFIKENRTTQEVEDFVKSLCDILPDTVTAQCHDVVDQYVPAILDLLSENLDPKQVCEKLGFCKTVAKIINPKQKEANTLYFHPRGEKKGALLGSNKCSWGPSHWCKSQTNAAECNAIEYCKQKGLN